MNYIKRLFNNAFTILNNRLSVVEKIIYSVLSVSLIIVTIIYFIQAYPYYFALVSGFVLFLIGVYLFITRFVRHQDKAINLKKRKKRKNTAKNYNSINTNGGNYNELIQGNYIQGDCINIQGNPIDISQDITEMVGEFRDILTKMVNQGYSTEEAVTQITNELLKEIRRKPEIKSSLFIDENANDSEVAEEFINLLISNNDLINRKRSLGLTYLKEDDYEERISYKGYTIYLEVDKDGIWHYKIDGFLYENTGESYFKYFAIDQAKGKIDEERFRNW